MAEEQQEQVLGVVAQYTKDLSFENINPISQITASNEQPNIDVQLKVNTNKTKQKDIYSVELITEITTKVKNTTLFVLELTYCGEFLIKGFDKELINPILYIECPRLLFPFARSIISNAVNEGGFPPLFLAPVDFASLYQQQMESQNQVKQ
ncbi:MAG: protein-export chaperone SecB [Alphaproteobacteria bacterium]|nr:protein-export chaperone SecB [Alphaproteobacteria bacterium]MBO7537118.1 protein-export chaperone SecB [Alphaproteobacteria bacterium]MBO7641836.1 protein-export chaperone SecB [Alphaproteobacteria bacterium]